MDLTVAEAVSGTLQLRSRFDSKSWWKKWHWDRFFSQYFIILLSVTFHQRCTIVFIYMLLLPEKNKRMKRGTLQREELSDAGKH